MQEESNKNQDLSETLTGVVRNLVHKLKTNQLELEIKNEELRQNQQNLKESFKRCSDLYEFAPISYFILSETGLILDANFMGADLLGMERFLLNKKPLYHFVPKKDHFLLDTHLKRVFENQNRQTCEIKLEKEDGTQLNVLLESVAIKTPCHINKCRTIIFDINYLKLREKVLQNTCDELIQLIIERKQAEKELQYRLRVERTLSIISTRFVSFSDLDEAITVTLADLGELMQADRSYVFLYHENNVTMSNTHEWCAPGIQPAQSLLQNLSIDIFPWWKQQLETRNSICVPDVNQLSPEAQTERKILKERNIHSLLVFPLHIGSEVKGYLGIDDNRRIRNWTEEDIRILRICTEIIGGTLTRKRAEEALRKMSATVEDLNESLKIINSILRHDILNDLTVVRGYLDLYKKIGDMELLERADDSIIKSNDLIQQMKELEYLMTHNNEGLQGYNARKIIDLVVKTHAASDVVISVNGEGFVLADPTFTSVIDNVIRNALMHANTERIDITIEEKEKWCVIRITDYGIGIPDKIKTKIFEPGFKYGKTAHTGIGLYIVKKIIVERYGGAVWVKNNIPKGSTFILKLKTSKKNVN
ncbi:MAG: ATP-binding protein [Promethearchaeota archaeon]